MTKLDVKLTPLKGFTTLNVTSPFGYRKFTYNGELFEGQHNGIDLTPAATIIAIAQGQVTAIRTNVTGYSTTFTGGNYVVIKHGSGVYTSYMHLAHGSVKVKVGDTVEKGAVLGSTVGQTTGHSTGSHLHLGIKVNGKYVDPMPYLLGHDTIKPLNEVVVVAKPVTIAIKTPTDPILFNVGDRVRIMFPGNGSSYGGRNKAYGIGWTRYITKIYEGRAFPYQVGNKGLTSGMNTTGFYEAKALKKV